MMAIFNSFGRKSLTSFYNKKEDAFNKAKTSFLVVKPFSFDNL